MPVSFSQCIRRHSYLNDAISICTNHINRTVNIWSKDRRLCTCLKQTCRDWKTSYPSLLWWCWVVRYCWKIVWNSVCSSLLCVRRLIKQMRLFCQEKCGIAIKCIISPCEKNVNVKILVSDNSGFYVIIEKKKPLVTHDHVHELKQGRLSITVASVWVATGQLINATLRHPFFSFTVECAEKNLWRHKHSLMPGSSTSISRQAFLFWVQSFHVRSFLSSVPPKFRSAAACRVTIDLHFVHSSVLPWCIICKGHPKHSAKLKFHVALLRICDFDQTPDTCFLLLERFSLARACLQEMRDYYFASGLCNFWLDFKINHVKHAT